MINDYNLPNIQQQQQQKQPQDKVVQQQQEEDLFFKRHQSYQQYIYQYILDTKQYHNYKYIKAVKNENSYIFHYQNDISLTANDKKG